MKDIVGVGSLNQDLIYEVEGLEIAGRSFIPGGEVIGTAEQFRSVLEEVEREGHLLQKSGGGSAANAVYSMSRMGFCAGFIGTVGNDSEGDFLIDSMGKVDCSHVKRAEATGACISLVAETDRSLILLPNANDSLTVTKDDMDFANDSSIVHLSSFVGDPALKEQIELVRSLNSDVLISFDPGEVYAKKGLDAIHPIIERSNIIFLNERELRSLTGQNGVAGAGDLMRMGPKTVVLKMGSAGSTLFSGGGNHFIPAKRVKVMDKTGAGDVYASGFLAGVLRGWGLEDCAEFATKAAAASIAAAGRDGYPDRMMLEKFERGEL
ncbi:MAG TPA: PfkB family carbohydrate kinase [Methanomassiliicoccales archaeon]|jgi:ribokinase